MTLPQVQETLPSHRVHKDCFMDLPEHQGQLEEWGREDRRGTTREEKETTEREVRDLVHTISQQLKQTS